MILPNVRSCTVHAEQNILFPAVGVPHDGPNSCHASAPLHERGVILLLIQASGVGSLPLTGERSGPLFFIIIIIINSFLHLRLAVQGAH